MLNIQDLLEERDTEGNDETERVDFILMDQRTGQIIGISKGMTTNFNLSQKNIGGQRGD